MVAQMNVDLCIIAEVAFAVRFVILLERRVCSCNIIYWKARMLKAAAQDVCFGAMV